MKIITHQANWRIILFSLLLLVLLACQGLKEDKRVATMAENSKSSALKSNLAENGSVRKDSFPLDKITSFKPDNPQRVPTRFKFTSGKIIDIREIDPYANQPYNKMWENEGGLERGYNLTNLPRKEQDRILIEARINNDAHRNTSELKMITETPRVEIKGDKFVVAYQAYFYCNEEDILATQGYACIYKKNGELLHTIEDKKDGFYDIRLSADGSYLMQKYGTNYGEDGSGQLNTGFKFYDTQSGEMVFELELGKDQFLGGYDFLRYDIYCTNYYRIKGQEFSYFVIDFLNRIVYEKTVNRKLMNNPGYVIFPSFIESRNVSDLLKDGFKKIN